MKHLGVEFHQIGEKRFFGMAGDLVMPVPPLRIYNTYYYPFMYSKSPKVTKLDLLWGLRVEDQFGNLPNESIGNGDKIGEINDGWVWLRPDDVFIDNPIDLYRRGTCPVRVEVQEGHLLPSDKKYDLRKFTKVEGGEFILKDYQKKTVSNNYLLRLNKEKSREIYVWNASFKYLKQRLDRTAGGPQLLLDMKEYADWINDVRPKTMVFHGQE